jgi:hypothetical protein
MILEVRERKGMLLTGQGGRGRGRQWRGRGRTSRLRGKIEFLDAVIMHVPYVRSATVLYLIPGLLWSARYEHHLLRMYVYVGLALRTRFYLCH